MRAGKSKNNWLNILLNLFRLIIKTIRTGSALRMKCRDVKYYLNDYLMGKLIDEMRTEISIHLKHCHSCRKSASELKAILKSTGVIWKKIHQTEELWEGISEPNENETGFSLPEILYSPLNRGISRQDKYKFRNKLFRTKWIAVGAPLSAVLITVLISVLYFSKAQPAFWEVEALKGSPTAGSTTFSKSGVLALGEWLTTDSHSKARLIAGMAGEIDVDPGSRLQLLETKDTGCRIFLQSGKIDARIRAPAKHFLIITPSATAIDLGCSYTIEVDKKGSSILNVTDGKLIIKSGGSEEIITAGTICETRKNKSPGTPYSADASAEFKEALSNFDFGGRTEEELETVLEKSTEKEAVSLWYLLKNSKPERVRLIYDRLFELVPPPLSVTYEGLLKKNEKMLKDWWEEMESVD